MDPKDVRKKVETPLDDDGQVSVEEAKRRLREAGVHVGGWTEHEEQVIKGHPMINRQKTRLAKLATILEGQVQKDKEALADLHIQLQRLKHGGGGS